MNASTDAGTWKRGGGHAGPAELEREGDELRADMDRTLDEIERELSPRKLMDRSIEFFREHGSDLVREAGESIRRNPMPVLLTAAGVVWLTAAVASSRSSSSSRREWDGGASHLDQDMASYDDFSAGHGYRGNTASSDTASRLRQGVHQGSSHLARLVREQPVALGALALAAGALLGAALPMTEYENRMIGPARDRSFGRDRGDMRTQSGESDESRDTRSSAGATSNDSTKIGE